MRTAPRAHRIFGPWAQTEFLVNDGEGFHSNDGRGVTSLLSARELTPVDPGPALVKTHGQEMGVRSEIVPGLQSAMALWGLRSGSELVFSGDAAPRTSRAR